MKILFPFFIFGKYGGVRVVTNILNIWADEKNEIEILTIGKEKPYFPVSTKIRIINCKNKFEIFKYIYEKFYEFDVIVGVYVIAAYLIFFASLLRMNFKKSFYYIQAYEADPMFGNKNNLWLMLAGISYKLPLHRIVNADIYKSYKCLKANDVVYPGLDLNLYYPKDINDFNAKLKIGCIGRMEAWKGTQDVCKAIEILKGRNVEVDFYIAFNDFKTVEHYFVKPDGDQNLSKFYREMDVVIAPGHIQLGAVHYPVIEAMAVGSTVITTGYLPADDTNAYIVGVKSPEKIADAIEKINSDRDRAIIKRRKALNDIQQFSWENVSAKFMSIIEKEHVKNDNAK